MGELDLNILGLYAGSWGEPRGNMDQVYDRFFRGTPALKGILSDFGRHTYITSANANEEIDGKPVFHTMMRWLTWLQQGEMVSQLNKEQTSVDFTTKEFLANAPKQRPALMGGLILSWTMRPGLVEQVAKGLPPDAELVNADQLADLSKEIKPPSK